MGHGWAYSFWGGGWGGGAGGIPEAVFFLFLCVGVLEGYLQFACVCVCGVCWRDTWSILFSFFCVGGVLQGDLKHFLFFSFFVWGGCWRDTCSILFPFCFVCVGGVAGGTPEAFTFLSLCVWGGAGGTPEAFAQRLIEFGLKDRQPFERRELCIDGVRLRLFWKLRRSVREQLALRRSFVELPRNFREEIAHGVARQQGGRRRRAAQQRAHALEVRRRDRLSRWRCFVTHYRKTQGLEVTSW